MTLLKDKIKNILEKLDLNKNQIKFYLALVELGQANLNEITKKSELKRPTAYRVEEELRQMNLIQGDLKKYKEKLTAVSPKRLIALVGNRQRKMRRLELEIKNLIPELNVLFADKKIKPKIELFNDEQGYFYLAEKSLECVEKEIYYFGNISDFYEIFTKEYDEKYYIPARIKNNIKLKWLVYKNKTTQQYQKQDKNFLRETKFLNPDYKINSSFLIFDNTLIFFSSHKEKIALSITSKYLAEMHKEIFKMIWATH